MRAFGLVALLSMVAVGCSSSNVDAPSPTTTGTQASPIINGSVDTDAHDSVVLIGIRRNGEPAGACTGTMVAPNLVLTARHCVSETDRGATCKADGTSYSGGQITGDIPPGDLLIYTGLAAIDGVEDDEQAAARGKEIVVESAQTLCDRDVAFIVLDRTVNTAVAPIRLKEGAREGETLTAVGWGLTEEGSQPARRMQRGGVRVEAIGPLILDEPTEIGLARSEFLVGEAFCSGDSGGPSFASTGALVGVVSRGGNGAASDEDPNRAASCIGQNTIGFYTHLANKAALVSKAFQKSGYTPRDEGAAPGKINTAKCSKNLDCSSNACIEGKCIARCDSAGKCASGEVCTTKSDIKVCVASVSPNSEAGSDEEEAPAAGGASPTRTTTITKEGCSAAGMGISSTSSRTTSASTLLFGLAALMIAFGRRRRR